MQKLSYYYRNATQFFQANACISTYWCTVKGRHCRSAWKDWVKAPARETCRAGEIL